MVNIQFGRLPPVRNEQVLVGVASQIISEARSELLPRIDMVIQNASAIAGTDIIYIRLGSDGVATTSLFKLDVDDIMILTTDQTAPCHQDVVSAICATANGKLNIIER